MSWFDPELSLTHQLRQEMDRRAAAHLSRDELAVLVDKLILDWYKHDAAAGELLKRIVKLETEIALSKCAPSTPGPSPEHIQWAQDLMQELHK